MDLHRFNTIPIKTPVAYILQKWKNTQHALVVTEFSLNNVFGVIHATSYQYFVINDFISPQSIMVESWG